MKVIEMVLLAESITTRSDMFVTFNNSQGIHDQKTLSGYTKLGRIPAETLRGWVRNAMEKLLLMKGVSICHPLPQNVIVNPRNKEYYEKDLLNGYHPRGECEKLFKKACPMLELFGDLNRPSKITIPSVYFYPASGGGTITNNISKVFGSIGQGRLDISRNSPRVRDNNYQVYMTSETITGVGIQAPWNIVIDDDNGYYEALVYKTLEFLFTKVMNNEKPFWCGGKRWFGYGRVVGVKVNEKGKYLVKNRNVIGIKNELAENIDEKFEKYVTILVKEFPIKQNNKKELNSSKNKAKQKTIDKIKKIDKIIGQKNGKK